MKRRRRRPLRVTGLETEYGCLTDDLHPDAVELIRDWVFRGHRHGLLDLHQRGWDEPPGNGGFLFNGGRLYLDMGHLEYCTPECGSAGEVVRYDRAGDRLLVTAVAALGLKPAVAIFRNNIDHHSGATFGCHENYSLSRLAPLTPGNVESLLTFLTLRVLLAGSGRVGAAHVLGGPVTPVEFQLSQRADHVRNDFYEWVQHNRAIINTRDEPLADPRQYRRLHLLHGDTNVLPSALYLKVGSTRLVLDLLEADVLPPVALADAVKSLRMLSRRRHPPWRVELADGREADAVEMLARFHAGAQRHLSGRDQETDAILQLWGRVTAGLTGRPDQLVGLVDWATKLHLLEAFRRREGLSWSSPWLEAQDLEYHRIDPEENLGLALADLSGPWAAGLDDLEAVACPPSDTRASRRSLLMHSLAKSGEGYEIDWHRVRRTDHPTVVMLDPFAGRTSARRTPARTRTN